MRKLKHHEQRLLKHVSLDKWKASSPLSTLCTKYYTDISTLSALSSLCSKISRLSLIIQKNAKEPTDKHTRLKKKLITLLYTHGLIPQKKFIQCYKINVKNILERQLNVILVRKKYIQNIKDATRIILQGHIQLNNTTLNKPNQIIPPSLEDFLKYHNKSKILRNIKEFNDQRDDSS